MSSIALTRPPSRIAAGLISLIAPGLGHVYAGHTRRGLTLTAVFLALQATVIAAIVLPPTFGATATVLIAAYTGLSLLYLFILIDAVRLARRGQGQRWYVWCGAIVLLWLFWHATGLLGPVAKALAPWQAYSVASKSMGPTLHGYGRFADELLGPVVKALGLGRWRVYSASSKSMEPTLRTHEQFIVDTTYYASNAPARGDVAIYRLPSDHSTLYLHRIVALGGDRIVFRDGHVVLNGVMATEPFADFGDPRAFYANTPELTVPAQHVFVAGDNRANATDSRARRPGPVPVANLAGRVTNILITDDLARVGLWVGSP